MNGKVKSPLQQRPRWMSLFWIVLLAVLLFSLFQSGSSGARSISYREFLSEVNSGKVAEVTAVGEQITGVFKEPVERGPKDHPVQYKNFPLSADRD